MPKKAKGWRGARGPESRNMEHTNLENILYRPEEFPEGPYGAPAVPDWRGVEPVSHRHRTAATQPAAEPASKPPREA